MIICAICGKPATIEGKSYFGDNSYFCDDCRKFVKPETIRSLAYVYRLFPEHFERLLADYKPYPELYERLKAEHIEIQTRLNPEKPDSK